LSIKKRVIKILFFIKYVKVVNVGWWFDPLQESMDMFMEKLTTTTIGSIVLKQVTSG
jgi:argininosuccinate synthase